MEVQQRVNIFSTKESFTPGTAVELAIPSAGEPFTPTILLV